MQEFQTFQAYKVRQLEYTVIESFIVMHVVDYMYI